MNAQSIMNNHRQPVRLAVFAVLLLATVGSLVTLSAAQEKVQPPITIAQLAGPWQITVVGNTGCGISALLFTGTMNSAGIATGTMTGASGCGTGASTQTFNIQSLNSNGSGTAGLTCGSGCGWNFTIQVNPTRQVFNLVDVTDLNQWLAGTAVKQ